MRVWPLTWRCLSTACLQSSRVPHQFWSTAVGNVALNDPAEFWCHLQTSVNCIKWHCVKRPARLCQSFSTALWVENLSTPTGASSEHPASFCPMTHIDHFPVPEQGETFSPWVLMIGYRQRLRNVLHLYPHLHGRSRRLQILLYVFQNGSSMGRCKGRSTLGDSETTKSASNSVQKSGPRAWNRQLLTPSWLRLTTPVLRTKPSWEFLKSGGKRTVFSDPNLHEAALQSASTAGLLSVHWGRSALATEHSAESGPVGPAVEPCGPLFQPSHASLTSFQGSTCCSFIRPFNKLLLHSEWMQWSKIFSKQLLKMRQSQDIKPRP